MIHVPAPTLSTVGPLSAQNPLNVRDSRWLQLEVCTEFAQGVCQKEECPWAHPPSNVKVEEGMVTVCYDYIKRKECKHGSCKYYHPPQHLVDSVLRKGDENKKIREQQNQEIRVRNLLSTQQQFWQPLQPAPSQFLNPYSSLLAASLPGGLQTGAPQMNPYPQHLHPSLQSLLAGQSLQQLRTISMQGHPGLAQDQSSPLETAYGGPYLTAAVAAAYAPLSGMPTRPPVKRPASDSTSLPDTLFQQTWPLPPKRPTMATSESHCANLAPSPNGNPGLYSLASMMATTTPSNGRLISVPVSSPPTRQLLSTVQRSAQPGAPPNGAPLMLSQIMRPPAPAYMSFSSPTVSVPNGGVASHLYGTQNNDSCLLPMGAHLTDGNGLMMNPAAFNQANLNPITNVAYINDKGQLLETLPICRDFKAGKCHRSSECRYVHLLDENVEVTNGRLTVCRDAVKGRCTRNPCKYFHIPLLALPSNFVVNQLATL